MSTYQDDFLSNSLVQLFDVIEKNCNVTFATFSKNSEPSSGNIMTKEQKYMSQYENEFDNQRYKYLYDPNLNFDFRFHQQLSMISYSETSKPWATLIFNTGETNPLTNVLSHMYSDTEVFSNQDGSKIAYEYKYRKQRVPVNFIVVSNDINYLNATTEKINMWFDRFVNFHYTSNINFSEDHSKLYEEVGHADNIKPVNLNKLDIERRGTIVSQAYSFDLIYGVIKYIPKSTVGILKRVEIEYTIRDMNEPLFVQIIP